MTDPFSIGGTAVGFASLGITACQGLVAYLNAWKSYHASVERTVEQLTSIEKTVSSLESIVADCSSVELTSGLVTTNLAACRRGVQDLRRFSETYCGTGSSTKSSFLLTHRKRVLFPFRKPVWKELRGIVNDLQTNLMIALQAFQIEQIKDLKAVSTSVALKVDQVVVQTRSNEKEVLHDCAESAMAADNTVTLAHNSNLALLPDQITSVKKCRCGWPRKVQKSLWPGLRSFNVLIQSAWLCPLHASGETRTDIIIPLPILSRALRWSIEACLSYSTGTSISLTSGLRAVRRVSNDAPLFQIVRVLVDSLSKSGKIRLDETEVVRAFRQFRRHVYEDYQHGVASPADVNENGDTLLTHVCYFIYALEPDGAYSRYIIDEYAKLLQDLVQFGVAVNEVGARGLTPLDTLVKRPLHDPADLKAQDSCLENICHLADKGAVITTKIDVRYEPAYLHRFGFDLSCLFRLEQIVDERIHGALGQSALLRDEQALVRLLSRKTTNLQERGFRGTTPLHLAADWPRGLRLLLEAGADPNARDDSGLDALMYSYNLMNIEAMKVLLDYDVNLSNFPGDWHLSYTTATGLKHMAFEMLVNALKERRRRLHQMALPLRKFADPDIPSMSPHYVLDVQASSLWKMLQDSRVALPAALLAPAQRTTIYHQLERLSQWSDNEEVNTCKLDYVHEAGFRDYDEVDCNGYTPLVNAMLKNPVWWRYVLPYWLMSKGANMESDVLVPAQAIRYPTLVIIAYGLGSVIVQSKRSYNEGKFEEKAARSLSWNFEAFGEKLLARWQVEFEDTPGDLPIQCKFGPDMKAAIGKLIMSEGIIHDGCICHCSQKGCSSMNAILKAYECFEKAGKYPMRVHVFCPDILQIYSQIVSLAPYHHQRVQSASSIVRWATFQRLGLTHTCCRYDRQMTSGLPSYLDAAEVKEIQAEETEDIELLETLLSEFEPRLREIDGNFVTFLEGDWRIRMDEVTKSQSLAPGEKRRIEELGVVVHDERSFSPDISSPGFH